METLILIILAGIAAGLLITFVILRLAAMLSASELSEDSKLKQRHVSLYCSAFRECFGNKPANADSVVDVEEIGRMLLHPDLDDEDIGELYELFAREVREIIPDLFDETYEQAKAEFHQRRLTRLRI
ncbi:MAG: hypothetical protein RL095_199 [Verrucomicrobiota bacterium]|jgi:hypothetical protein